MHKQGTRKEVHSKFLRNSQEVILRRRELVARLRIRGLSMREIVDALGKPGEHQLLNPRSGEAFTLGTIRDDCHALDREWREAASRDVATHKARVYMEIQEVKRRGWKSGELAVVLRALKQECDLLGLDAPKQVDVNLIRSRAREIAERLGIPVGDVLAQAAQIAEDAMAGTEL